MTRSPAEPATYEVLGRSVTMPVQVREAQAMTALFALPSAPLQRMIEASGLRVPSVRGRSMLALVFVRYLDNDLGPYDELGVSVLVKDPIGGPRAVGVLIHELPVDGEFTCAAGRSIWGFPKQIGAFDVALGSDGRPTSVDLHLDGSHAVGLSVTPARVTLPFASRASTALAAYSHLDGVLRRTTWEMAPQGLRTRLGGAEVRLGDHPLADALREVGLPRRALTTTTIENLQMTFGEPEQAARPQ